VVDQKLFTLEQVRTVLVLQGLRLKASQLFWIKIGWNRAFINILLPSIGDCSLTIDWVTQQPPRVNELSERGRIWSLNRIVHSEDWAPTGLNENAPLQVLGSSKA
jgi:hypothetical protein